MIESGKVDLGGDFDIDVGQYDHSMTFAGFSVSVISGVDNYARLVKKETAETRMALMSEPNNKNMYCRIGSVTSGTSNYPYPNI
jgi:hypothetical protein